jgi:hypothetical protein
MRPVVLVIQLRYKMPSLLVLSRQRQLLLLVRNEVPHQQQQNPRVGLPSHFRQVKSSHNSKVDNNFAKIVDMMLSGLYSTRSDPGMRQPNRRSPVTCQLSIARQHSAGDGMNDDVFTDFEQAYSPLSAATRLREQQQQQQHCTVPPAAFSVQ